MNINIDKEKMKKFGLAAAKIGKHIVIEGTIAVTAKGVTQGLRVGLEDGFDGVKKMDVDDYLGIKNQKKRKTLKEVIGAEKAIENDTNDSNE